MHLCEISQSKLGQTSYETDMFFGKKDTFSEYSYVWYHFLHFFVLFPNLDMDFKNLSS